MTHDTFHLMGEGILPYRTNQATQTLEALPQGDFVRNLRGDLVFLGAQGGHKYKSTVQGFDPHPPTFGSLMCGQKVIVYAMERLLESASGPGVHLTRPPVPESLFGMNAQGNTIPVILEENGWVRVDNWEQDTGIYLSYCPVLTMMITGFSLGKSGNTQQPLWTMTLEEV